VTAEEVATAGDPPSLRVALCQLDTVVGDLAGNVEAILEAHEAAEAAEADVAIFPELAVTGYPPEDLLLKGGFVEEAAEAVAELASRLRGHCAAVVGWVEGRRHPGADPHDASDGPWNAAAVLHGGRVKGSYRKQCLPNYGVFDEKRYFDPGAAEQPLYVIGGVPLAITVCEDVWVGSGPASRAARRGARLVLNINASPFHAGKQAVRETALRTRVEETGVPIAYVNQVGGQDELIFDGGSMVMDHGGLLARAPRFEEGSVVLDVPLGDASPTTGTVVQVSGPRELTRRIGGLVAEVAPSPEGPGELWRALCLGTADYTRKNGFTDVVLGLSGGVDSALVAAIAADAVGPERVHAVLMPSRFSSAHSVSDAEALADQLGLQRRTIGIEGAHAAFLEMLSPSFEGLTADLTEENLQSRIRGVVLMALSNKFGWLVLTTGNKSETAVGYSTLYGDTAGGLAVIKDLPKLAVYELCRWRNARDGVAVIPESILTKAPSAELRPDQRDDQSLPPYEVLDPLIEAYVDGDLTVDQLVEMGHDPELVRRVARLVDLAEYKRRQSPPGLRVSEKAFGRDRRLPITNAYRPRR
jgi:NAD+ synthase (glutamine-hydrolysing)